ncbi:MAG: UDP-3-O-acyl-N-acetylglucosamine deacetylase [Planctomycetota bacterium]
MPSSRPQQTLARPAVVAGHGYWTGSRVVVEFRPAPVDAGLYFVRDDLVGAPRVPVGIAAHQPAARRTILSQSGATVEMVEHVLAALCGLGVDNCEIGVTAAELPGCDGSALAFVEAIVLAGLRTQTAPSTPLVVEQPVRCTDGPRWIEARPAIGDGLSVEYNLDYGADAAIPAQWAVAEVTPATFCAELAPARTFVLEAEAEAIRSQGLASHVSPRDLLIFGDDGPIENTLRFPDECARHKALDVVGDLALAGRPVVGHIVAHRSGHRLNAELVGKLLALAESSSSETPSSPNQPQSPGQPPRRRSA